MTRQLAIRLSAALAVAALLSGCTSAAHYRTFHRGKSLYRVAYTELQPGDTYEKVAALLGPGELMNDKRRARMARGSEQYPKYFPDGVKETDIFFNYPLNKGESISLQFRDRKLVNFTPDEFKTYEKNRGEVVGG
jgi:hypothetical protein